MNRAFQRSWNRLGVSVAALALGLVYAGCGCGDTVTPNSGACSGIGCDGGGGDATMSLGGSSVITCPQANICNGSCCKDTEECVDGYSCQPPCANTRCGDNGSLCCAANQICLDGVQCASACKADEAVCGANLDVCCKAGDKCLNGTCQTPGIVCGNDFDCLTDGQYCEPTIGRCLPTPSGAVCEVRPTFQKVTPRVEWHWAGVTLSVSGSSRTYQNVTASPVVGDVSGDGIPDVVVPAYYGANIHDGAILVALSGAPSDADPDNGELLFHIGGDVDDAKRPQGAVSVALGNFDSDPQLEIVYRMYPSGIRIVEWNPQQKKVVELTSYNSGKAMGVKMGPALAQLTADQVPDVVIGCQALDGAKLLAGQSPTIFDKDDCSFGGDNWGGTVVADLNGDGSPDVTSGGKAYKLNGDVLWSDQGVDGFPAISDLDGDGKPEVVVTRSNQVQVRKGADGAMLIGPGGAWLNTTINVPGTNDPRGGPPVVADFDNDGKPEFGAAGDSGYALYDPDCISPAPRTGGVCPQGASFQRWTMPTQDKSSAVTGSSVFDFQGDGVAEVIYNDEYFLHIYSGADGTALLDPKIANSSRTAIEYPIVVDVDRDGNSEIVVGANDDQLSRDKCAVGTHGVYVYGDQFDRWVRTRPIWNQYTYHVTNVSDLGDIPKPEATNWTTAGLNNYRQNVQGKGVFNAPNLTVKLTSAAMCGIGKIRLVAEVTNVGSRGVSAGIPVDFVRVLPAPEATLGTAATTRALLPGETERVSLTVENVSRNTPLDYEVRVDGASSIAECIENDNSADASEECKEIEVI